MPHHKYSDAEIAALLAEACLHAGVIEVDGWVSANRPDWTREAFDVFSRQGWISRWDGQRCANWQTNDGDLQFDCDAWRAVLARLKARLGHPLEASPPLGRQPQGQEARGFHR